jgi:hypothetical protein
VVLCVKITLVTNTAFIQIVFNQRPSKVIFTKTNEEWHMEKNQTGDTTQIEGALLFNFKGIAILVLPGKVDSSFILTKLIDRIPQTLCYIE